MRLIGKRVAVLVENLYQEMEVWYPYYRLQEAGAVVEFVGPRAGVTYTSKLGYPCTSDLAAHAIDASRFDAVVVPGGYAPDLLRRDQGVLDLVHEMNEAGKIIAAICHAGWVLVSAKVLEGRTATCFAAIKDDIINAGAKYVDEDVVVDGNLITSRTPHDLPAFCRELVALLAGHD